MKLLKRLRGSQPSLLPPCLPRRTSRRKPITVLFLITSTLQRRGGKSTVLGSRSRRFHRQQNQRRRECLEFPEDQERTSSGATEPPRWVKPTLRGRFLALAPPQKSQLSPWSVSKEDAITLTSRADWNKTNMFLFLINNQSISFVVFTCIIYLVYKFSMYGNFLPKHSSAIRQL